MAVWTMLAWQLSVSEVETGFVCWNVHHIYGFEHQREAVCSYCS